MHFVELEPKLCVSTAPNSRRSRAADRSVRQEGGGEGVAAGIVSGENTVWGGLFLEVMRVLTLGPFSMRPKLLKALGEDYVNVHDDVRCGSWWTMTQRSTFVV